MFGKFRYVTTVESPVRSPYASPAFYDIDPSPYNSDPVPIGTVIDILLDWGYTSFDPTRVDTRYVPVTPTGFAEVISHGWREGTMISLRNIESTSIAGYASDYDVMNAVNDHLSKGTVQWFPNFTDAPADFITVVAKKIMAPKRFEQTERFTFDFDLMHLPAAQGVRTIPDFVAV